MSEAEDRAKIRAAMRVPIGAFIALLTMLILIILLGQVAPGRAASYTELGITLCMVVTVLLFSMEVRQVPPLMKLYASAGFFWLAILTGMTMLDYLTR